VAAGVNAPAPLYTRDILRLASAIPHQRGFGEVEGVERRSPTCGSRVRVAVTLDGGGRVATFAQAVEACAFGQAAAALVGGGAIGRSGDELRAALAAAEAWLADPASPEPWPGFASLAPVRERAGRHGAVLLPLRALAAAIEAAR
jgi:NifU-like protein involved in Fe-S cluster formation